MGRLSAERAVPLERRLREALTQSVQLRRAGLLHWQRHPPSVSASARRPAMGQQQQQEEEVVSMGSLYPLYSLGSLRNLAAHVFDASDAALAGLASAAATGGAAANATAQACAARARAVRPCDVVFASALSSSMHARNGGGGGGGGGGGVGGGDGDGDGDDDDDGGSMTWFAAHVHPFISSPYLLISDGGGGGGGGTGGAGSGTSRLRATRAVVAMLSGSSPLRSWWAARTQLPLAPPPPTAAGGGSGGGTAGGRGAMAWAAARAAKAAAPFDRVRLLPTGLLSSAAAAAGTGGGSRRRGKAPAPLNATEIIEAALLAQAVPKTGWLLLPAAASDGGGGSEGRAGGEAAAAAAAAAAEMRAAFAGWRDVGGIDLTVTSLDASSKGAAAGAAAGTAAGAAGQGVPPLALLARHRFVLCAAANSALTWATLLAGSTPVVRAPTREEARLLRPLPVLAVGSWDDVTPQLLRARDADDAAHLRPLYAYELLFADAWAGRVAAARERCLARHRAASRADSEFTYDYHKRGGWVETRGGRRIPEPMIKTLGNMAKD